MVELQTIVSKDFTITLAFDSQTRHFSLCSDEWSIETKHFSAGQESNITRAAVFFWNTAYVFSSFINILAEQRFYAAR